MSRLMSSHFSLPQPYLLLPCISAMVSLLTVFFILELPGPGRSPFVTFNKHLLVLFMLLNLSQMSQIQETFPHIFRQI